MENALLECGALSASDGEGRRLFEGVEVTLTAGQLVLLEGPSGAGKSTLLRQVAGLTRAAAARRVLEGRTFKAGDLPLWRSRVTLLAQDAPMLRGTVADNLRFPFALHHAPRDGRERSLEGALQDVDLAHLPLDREVATISGGERHRLALARALLWDPPVLLADEPLAGLDPNRAELCFAKLAAQARRPGRAVLCVLHEAGRERAGDARLVLANGGLRVA